ncbi:unnamed protein product [Mytilus coruscus]|uniref:Uncharacterized protein n=1 Tax=Mytilus coruscus TaxID=42192 RepID=A0A6J8E3C2_MYTCO|nr:unnamed protein product [Mytilus coruscus]
MLVALGEEKSTWCTCNFEPLLCAENKLVDCCLSYVTEVKKKYLIAGNIKMKNTFFILTILMLYTSNTVIFSCNIQVCLTWQAEKDGISFKCKVNKLLWKVMFYNPSNQELAHCLMPFPIPECYTSPNNTIRQSSITNTTIFIVKQRIQSSLNGQWKCSHGTNVDEATVNITVLKEECTCLNGIPVCICLFKGRHVLLIGLICIVTGTPIIAGLFNTECKSKQRSGQAEPGTQNHTNGDSNEGLFINA